MIRGTEVKARARVACKGKRRNLDRYRSPLHLISASIAIGSLIPRGAKIENSLLYLCQRNPENTGVCR